MVVLMTKNTDLARQDIHWHCLQPLHLPTSPKEARFKTSNLNELSITCYCPKCNILVELTKEQFRQARKDRRKYETEA
jgi:hypothetical protein